MKYLKLFEAFESKILSKTLGYIKSKTIFLNQLKAICQVIDYPMAELSDDVFEYLPFKKALNVAAKTGDEPCDAKSVDYFNREFGIEGERCTDGKIKRKWGKGIRQVPCPSCKGTGVKPKQSEIKLIKFWFNSGGEYITTTAVDGVIRPEKETIAELNDTNYVPDRAVSRAELKHLDVVKINLRHGIEFGVVWRPTGDYSIWIIQNTNNGDKPRGDEWRKYGRFSWTIASGEFIASDGIMLMKKSERLRREEGEEVNPYTWNTGIDIGTSKMVIRNNSIRDQIDDANFAIVMDFGKLKSSDYKSKSTTARQRISSKEGSVLDPEMTDIKIKRKNIDKYFNKMTENMDITVDIANCNALVKRLLGHTDGSLYNVYRSFSSKLYDVMGAYYNAMKDGLDDSTKKAAVEIINAHVKNGIESGRVVKLNASGNLEKIKNFTNTFVDMKELLKSLNDLNVAIYQTLTKNEINTIEDLEVVYFKANSILNVIKNPRYLGNNTTLFDYLIRVPDKSNVSSLKTILESPYYVKADIIEKIKKSTLIISKL